MVFLTGCGKSMQQAHELAAPNLYHEATYENAAQPGPSVVVLPGNLSSETYEFLSQVKSDNLREYGELELGKANFKVLEKNSLANIYQEIAVAANLGDGSVAKRFSKHKITPPQWLVVFDIAKVHAQTLAFSFTDKNSAMFAGALMGSFLGSASLGQGVVGSINAAKEQRVWDITLRYRILDGVSGQQLHEGCFTEQATINRELTGFLGVDAAQAGGLTLGTVTQRLVQKAVADIDKQHKLSAMTEPEPTPKAGKGSKAAKAGKADMAAMAEKPGKRSSRDEPAAGAAKPDVPCVQKNLGGFVCQMPEAWSTGTPPRAVEVAVAQKPELGRLLEQSQRSGKSGFIDSIVAFDILRTAGPLVTLTEPESPLSKMGKVLAVSGNDVEGRVFILSAGSGDVSPQKLTDAILGHMRNAVVVEPLGVETVSGKDGQRNIGVFKYIKVERRKELKEKPDYDRDAKDEYKLISIPHYHNMAMAVVPKGGEMLLVIVIAPEEKFLPHLEGVKRLVESAA
jgi:hypothetical protein